MRMEGRRKGSYTLGAEAYKADDAEKFTLKKIPPVIVNNNRRFKCTVSVSDNILLFGRPVIFVGFHRVGFMQQQIYT